MATLREYFDTDVKTLALQAEWGTKDDLGTTTPPVIAKIVQDLEANAKYWRFFIPEGANPGSYANMLFAHPLTERCWLSEEGDSVIVRAGFAHYPGRASSTTLVFTRRIFLYIDSLLSVTDRQAVTDLGGQRFIPIWLSRRAVGMHPFAALTIGASIRRKGCPPQSS